jgi:hypothetical protein
MQLTPTEAAFAASAFVAVCAKLLDLTGHFKKI